MPSPVTCCSTPTTAPTPGPSTTSCCTWAMIRWWRRPTAGSRCASSRSDGTFPSSSRWPPGPAPHRTAPDDETAGVPAMPPEPPVPASTTPVQDYLDGPAPGATPEFLVVPRSLAQSMPLRWQQVFVGLLADLHDAYDDLPWPE